MAAFYKCDHCKLYMYTSNYKSKLPKFMSLKQDEGKFTYSYQPILTNNTVAQIYYADRKCTELRELMR